MMATRERIPSMEFPTENPAENPAENPKTTFKSSTQQFLMASILCIALSLLGIVAVTPLCQTEHIQFHLVTYGSRSYYPTQCVVRNAGSIASIAVAFMTSCLIGAGLHQLSGTRPLHAGTTHFVCMFVWAIIFAGLNLFMQSVWVGVSAAGVPTASLGGCNSSFQSSHFYCYSYYGYGSNDCAKDKQIFNDTICKWEQDNAAGTYFFMLSNWILWLFTIGQIVVASRTPYWCCDGAKRDCNECSPCCKLAPGAVNVQPQVALQVAGATMQPAIMGANPYPSLQQNPVVIQTSEVALWLTNALQLPQYIPSFTQNGYTRMQAVISIQSEEQLRTVLPDVLPGHSALILSSISNLRAQQHAVQLGAGVTFATAVEGTAVTGNA